MTIIFAHNVGENTERRGEGMKRTHSWITSRIASCMDCKWRSEDQKYAADRAREHARKHNHKTVVEAAKVTHYDFREKVRHD